MIKGIFVIYNTGICLYNKSIPNISPNDQLIAGFISALDRFCKNSIGENITHICTKTLKFHFIRRAKLIFVFLSNIKDDTQGLLPQFKDVIDKFHDEFSNQQVIFERDGLIPILTNFDTCCSNLCI